MRRLLVVLSIFSCTTGAGLNLLRDLINLGLAAYSTRVLEDRLKLNIGETYLLQDYIDYSCKIYHVGIYNSTNVIN